jgi:hypothetical protein
MPTKDTFHLHRLALTPLLTSTPASSPQRLGQAITEGGTGLIGFIEHNGLAPLWYQALHNAGVENPAAQQMRETLGQSQFAGVALYMAQRAALRELDRLFQDRSIPYVVIKGGLVRELVYADPTLRPATDLDILIHPDKRQLAAIALNEAGYAIHVDPSTISHEVSFTRAGVEIDLHWDILRPGRTRMPMTAAFLARRLRYEDLWGLDSEDVAFLMLVHPAFAKYVCSPNMGLNRVADFILWVRGRQISWDKVADRLEAAGLKTAAWMVLAWFRILAGPEGGLPIPETFIARIHPGKVRATYLYFWLNHDLPTRWLNKPWRIQLGLTLVLHDRATDVFHALVQWLKAQGSKHQDAILGLGAEPHY